ncbi:MAG: hypothetical protein GX117_04580 [Candidatus Hydrogenedentes bacterium]|jgi:protein arginine kinase activator|nr:hypothetical protein [Candidatus Hydrogenedentota bacterium]
MMCNFCKKNLASVKFTEVVDGKAIRHALCPDCYKAFQEGTASFSFPIPKPESSGGGGKAEVNIDRSGQTKCPGCGLMAAFLLELGQAGCPTCFTAFEKEIDAMLQEIQPETSYRGKVFKCDDDRVRLSKDIREKRVLLRQMVKEENYEEAARLRDEIARMERKAQETTVSG